MAGSRKKAADNDHNSINDPLNLWPNLPNLLQQVGQGLIDGMTRAARQVKAHPDPGSAGTAKAPMSAAASIARTVQTAPVTKSTKTVDKDSSHLIWLTTYIPGTRTEQMPPGESCARVLKEGGKCQRANFRAVQCSATRDGDNLPCNNWVHAHYVCCHTNADEFKKPAFRWNCSMVPDDAMRHSFDKAPPKSRAGRAAQRGLGELSFLSSSLSSLGDPPSTPPSLQALRESCSSPSCVHPGIPLAIPDDSARDPDSIRQLHAMRCQVIKNGLQCVHQAHRQCASVSEDLGVNRRFYHMVRYDCRRDWPLRHDYGTDSARDIAARLHNERVQQGLVSDAGSPSQSEVEKETSVIDDLSEVNDESDGKESKRDNAIEDGGREDDEDDASSGASHISPGMKKKWVAPEAPAASKVQKRRAGSIQEPAPKKLKTAERVMGISPLQKDSDASFDVRPILSVIDEVTEEEVEDDVVDDIDESLEEADDETSEEVDDEVEEEEGMDGENKIEDEEE